MNEYQADNSYDYADGEYSMDPSRQYEGLFVRQSVHFIEANALKVQYL